MMTAMQSVKRRVVDGLEVACRATRLVEWIPGWHRVYPRCFFARLSSRLDHRWGTARWPIHDEDDDDAWDEWIDNLQAAKPDKHCHAW